MPAETIAGVQHLLLRTASCSVHPSLTTHYLVPMQAETIAAVSDILEAPHLDSSVHPAQ
jgi:hypothetical protein